MSIERVSPKEIYRRNWKKYSKTILLNELSKQDWQIKKDSVQSYWNEFESNLVKVIDKIAPLQLLSQIEKDKSKPPPHIKNKINKRNRLLKNLNRGPPNPEIRSVIKALNKEIKIFFHKQKTILVRRGILPGNSKTLWDAVKIAKD